ncbi:hypothetical protein MNB_SM-4-338 [hydrothermal vent metagenome]|uniref:Ferric uptake regulation protein FUR n=1 Tax=hydrothermal vent metagenome TaxID=652676 RepID=A0A1W1BL72_9ZZZZ
MYNYIKENKLRYSDQRERVLKIMYTQNYPVSVDFLVKKLNEQTLGAGYATVARHLKFFDKLDMLIVVAKSQKGYLLKKSVNNCNVEVVSHDNN